MGQHALIGASPTFHARVSGAMGALVLASGSLAGTVSSRLIVRDDAAVTATRILDAEMLFRAGITGSLVMMVAWLFYAMLLFRLLRPAGRNTASVMLVLVIASVPIYMLNQVDLFAVLLAASAGLDGEVALFLESHRFGNLVAAIFFGLWLLPLGLSVYRSGFLPRWLGVLLMVGTLGYLVLFVQAFFFPGSERTLWTNPFLAVTHLAELALLLWLLIKGVDDDRWAARAHEDAGRGAA